MSRALDPYHRIRATVGAIFVLSVATMTLATMHGPVSRATLSQGGAAAGQVVTSAPAGAPAVSVAPVAPVRSAAPAAHPRAARALGHTHLGS